METYANAKDGCSNWSGGRGFKSEEAPDDQKKLRFFMGGLPGSRSEGARVSSGSEEQTSEMALTEILKFCHFDPFWIEWGCRWVWMFGWDI